MDSSIQDGTFVAAYRADLMDLVTATTPIEIRARALNLAETLLLLIKCTFNDAVGTCESCGTEHKVNWDEFQAKEFASAAITRIQRIRKLLPKEESNAVGD